MPTKSPKTTKTSKPTNRTTKESAMKTTPKRPAAKSTSTKSTVGKKAAKPEKKAPAPKPAKAAKKTDPDTAIEAAHEEAMAAARDAVAAGADAKVCSDLVSRYQMGAVDRETFLAEIGAATRTTESAPAADATPDADEAPTEAPIEEPAPMDAAATEDATVANTDAPAAEADAPAPRDTIDILISRAQSTTPEALGLFVEATPAKDLRAMLERLTGEKTSPRLSPAKAIERIKAALAPAAEPAGEAAAASGEVAAKPAREFVAHDLPPVGTVLQKKDRHGNVRCECTIVEGGVLFVGETYKSLSAAAIAASRSLGLDTKQTSGPKFWGLLPSTTRARTKNPSEVIGAAWDRYHERVEAALRFGGQSEMAELHTLLNAHSSALLGLAAKAVEGAEQEPSA